MTRTKNLSSVGRFAAFTEEEVLTIRAALYAMEIGEISHGTPSTKARGNIASRLANESLLGTPLKVPENW